MIDIQRPAVAINSDLSSDLKDLLKEYHLDCLRRRINPDIAKEYTHQNEKLLKLIPSDFKFNLDLKSRDYRPILHNINDHLIE